MEEEPDGTDDGGDQLPPLPAAPAPVSGDVEEVRREAKVVITAIKRQPSASLAVHTDLQGALRSVDLKLPEAFRASSRGASTLAREANARWSTVLTRVQVSRYARTLPAIRRVGADGGGRRGPLTKEAFDTAADELLRTMKSSSEVYAGQQAQTAQVTRLPVIEAAAPARKPRRADRRPAKRRLASSGSDRGRASSLVSAGEVAEARGGYSQSAVRQEVRQKLAALRSDPEARERFYEEICARTRASVGASHAARPMRVGERATVVVAATERPPARPARLAAPCAAEMIAARQGDQDSFIQHNIVAVSDGSVSPRARHLRLQELAQRRDEKIRIAKLRKEAVDHEQRERLEAELSRLSKLRERRIQRELEDEKQRAVLRWMTVYAYVTALGRLGVTLRRERRLREKHRAARVLQRELRSFTRRSYMRRLTRAINTIQKFTWRMLLAHHVRVKRRSTWIVRKWLAATGAAGIPSRVIRNFRFAVVKIQMFFRSMAIVRNAQLTLLGERWRHVLKCARARARGLAHPRCAAPLRSTAAPRSTAPGLAARAAGRDWSGTWRLACLPRRPSVPRAHLPAHALAPPAPGRVAPPPSLAPPPARAARWRRRRAATRRSSRTRSGTTFCSPTCSSARRRTRCSCASGSRRTRSTSTRGRRCSTLRRPTPSAQSCGRSSTA